MLNQVISESIHICPAVHHHCKFFSKLLHKCIIYPTYNVDKYIECGEALKLKLLERNREWNIKSNIEEEMGQ